MVISTPSFALTTSNIAATVVATVAATVAATNTGDTHGEKKYP